MSRSRPQLRPHVLMGLWIALPLGVVGCSREAQPQSDPSNSSSAGIAQPTTQVNGPEFIEVSGPCGLKFVHFNGATGQWRFPEIMGAGCALFDFDNDGDLDVYAVQGAWLAEGKALAPPVEAGEPHDRLFRNDLRIVGSRRELKFVNVTESSGIVETGFGMGCAVGDVNNDGWADLYVTNVGANRLYLNHGGGVFEDRTDASGTGDAGWGTSASFFDYDRDGLLDLVVANYLEYDAAKEPECRSTHRHVRDYCVPRDYPPTSVRLYRNLSDARFEHVTESSGLGRLKSYGLGVIARDFNDDGWVDVYVANDSDPNHLWINRRDGTFEERALDMGVAVSGEGKPQASMGLVVADFDGDQDGDVFVSHIRGEHNTYYRQDRASGFVDVSYEIGLAPQPLQRTGFGAVPIDFDNDGWQDLFVANGGVSIEERQFGQRFPYAQVSQLFRNERGQFSLIGFAEDDAEAQPMIGRGTALGDVDNDGDEDLLVSANAGPLRLLLNESPRQHWIRFRLIGMSSPRDGSGTRVAVRTTEGREIVRVAATDGSYCSASDGRVHVGLGQGSRAVDVTFHWPSGRIQRLINLAVDCEHVIGEPEPGTF